MQVHDEREQMRADLQRDNPSLVAMYDAFLEQGGDVQSFRAFVQNDSTRAALTKLTALEADASALLNAGVSNDKVWNHTGGDAEGGYQVDVDGREMTVTQDETFGLKTLNALADLQTGLGEIQEQVPLDKMVLAVQVAALGPAGFALDYVKGMAVDTFAGKYIKAGTDRLATVLNAGAHDTDSETAAYLLSNRAKFEDLQDAAFNGTDFDPKALSNAENLLSLNQDFNRTQAGATMLAVAVLMGAAALKGRRTESTTTTPDVKTGAGYGVNDPPVRIQGEWTEADLKQALLGYSPKNLGKPELHHAGQMPGSGIHEVLPDAHKSRALHPNKFNQGVTNEMRNSDKKLHWWYRAREQGADQLLPDWIYDN